MGQFDAPTTFSRQQPPPVDNSGIFLGLGSNLGSRLCHLSEAVKRLEKRGLQILNCSSLYETEPVDRLRQPDFINLNIEIKTDLDAEELLEACLAVEREIGRVRTEPKGPRIIDIDLLFYDQLTYASDRIWIPHPAIARRRFILVPMVEIASEFHDPLSGLTMRTLLEKCPDRSSVRWLGPFEHVSDSCFKP